MKKIFDFIVNKRIYFLVFWIVLLVGSIIMVPFVNINYDTTEYLPESSRTKESLKIMKDEFGLTGQASVMIEDVTIEDAIRHKNNLLQINNHKEFKKLADGIIMEIMWLDSFVDSATLMQISNFLDGQQLGDFDLGLIPGLNQFYADGSALLQVVFVEDDHSLKVGRALELIRDYFSDRNIKYALGGTAVSAYYTRELTQSEVLKITMYVLPIVFLILILFTSSWAEPVIFLIVVGVSVLINMGTNLMFPAGVSFLTNSTASLLQLAISMDYAIFLLHAFTKERDAGLEKIPAMKKAMTKSFTSITASMLTTIAGFIALMFMRYTIGIDLAGVMIKGIVLSLLSTFTLLPVLILFSDKLLTKTKHRPFFPDISFIGKYIIKLRYVLPALVLLVAIPTFNAQNSNTFIYGDAAMGISPGTAPAIEKERIEAKFGRSNMIVVLVPLPSDDDYTEERAMITKLNTDLGARNFKPNIQALSTLTDLNTYLGIDTTKIFDYIPSDIEIPEEIKDFMTNIMTSEDWILGQVPEDFKAQLRSENYSRIIISIDTDSESKEAFEAAAIIQSIVSTYYVNDSHIIGVTPSVKEIKNVVETDFVIINLLSIILVFVIILVSTRSLVIPLVLVFVIEFSIWVNMSIPFLTNSPLIFIGYMIVSAVQLGATIDYGILFSDHYMKARETMIRRDAIRKTLKETSHSILTSALILTTAGYALKIISSVEGVASLGELIGRGAALSGFLVLFLLPQLLYLFDKLLEKLTWRAKFYRPDVPKISVDENNVIIERDEDESLLG